MSVLIPVIDGYLHTVASHEPDPRVIRTRCGIRAAITERAKPGHARVPCGGCR